MVEWEDGKYEGDPDRRAIIRIEPVGVEIRGDGSKGLIAKMDVFATDREMADDASRLFVEMTGAELTQEPSGSSSSFAFSSSAWHAPWEPTGPRRNWGATPSAGDPSLN